MVASFFFRCDIDFSGFLVFVLKSELLRRKLLTIDSIFNCFLHLSCRATEITKTNCCLKFTLYRIEVCVNSRTLSNIDRDRLQVCSHCKYAEGRRARIWRLFLTVRVLNLLFHSQHRIIFSALFSKNSVDSKNPQKYIVKV